MATKRYPKNVQDRARKLAREGKTATQIARSLAVPKRVVKRWTIEQRDARNRDRALRLSKFGRNAKEIALRLDLRVAEVERWLSNPNAHPRSLETSFGARHGTETRRCARRMAECQDPVTHISEVLGVTPKTTRTWLREIETEDGVSLLPGERRRTHDRNAILEDVRATDANGKPLYTRSEIREKYGCSQKFLSHLVHGRLTP